VHGGSFHPGNGSSSFPGPPGTQNATKLLEKFQTGETRRPHQRPSTRRRLARAVEVVAVVLVAVAPLGSTASASTVVDAGTITTVANPGIALHIPADGRLDGDGFAADVSGYRFAYQIGLGPDAEEASAGQVLLVFALIGSGAAIQAQLLVDGLGTVLPHATTPNASTPAYFLASMPAAAADVALQASADGFSQTFSFTKGEREGPQPVVLYRGRGQWQAVDAITRGITSVPTPDNSPVDDVPGSVVNFDITAAMLTYFLPGTEATPANPAKEWLVMSGSALPAGGADGHQLQYQATLPGSAITLTLPGKKPAPAMLTGQGSPADEGGDNGRGGLFGGSYYWEVPATVSSGIIRIALPAELSARAGYYGDQFGAVHDVPVQGSVPPVNVAFAPVYAPPRLTGPNPPAWAPKPAAVPTVRTKAAGHLASAVDKSGGTAGRSSTVTLFAIAVVAAALVAAGALFALKRRQLVPALAGLLQTPAQRREADVEAFIAAPRDGVVGGAARPLPKAMEPSARERLPGTSSSPSAEAPAPRSSPAPPTPTPAPVLLPIPDGPPPLPKGAVELQLIGRVRLAGDVPKAAVELSEPALEALAALALQEGQPLTREELRALLGAGRETERSAGTVSNYLANLRRVFGPDRVPEASGAGGYRVVGIGTDFARFHDLVRQAKAEPDSAARHLADALSLVRGVPFSGAPEHSYGWADRHDLGAITTKLLNSVHRAAVDLAHFAIEAGDGTVASWAAERGLTVWQEDEELDELYLSAAAISSDRSALARAWAAVKRPYDSRDEEVPARLVAQYQSLRKRAQGPT
jgi:hypothetical protein